MMAAKSIRRGLSLVTLACLLVLGVGSSDTGSSRARSSAPTDQWFQGGTLNGATHAQWMAAPYRNKLATASDWLAATIWNGHLNTPADFDRLKLSAQRLVRGVDGVASVDGTGGLQVNQAAASLIAMSNNLGP